VNLERLDAMGVPARPRRALQGAFQETEPVAVVQRWRSTNASILVLCGAAGAGKSTAAAWALGTAVRRVTWKLIDHEPIEREEYLSGRWVCAEDLAKASDFVGEFWEPLRRVELLVIDEVDPRWLDSKGRALANLSGLLRRRYDNDLRSILTSNLSPAEWLREYGDADGGRLRDRLREAEVEFGESPLVAITGKSLRGAKGRP
jgi:hypothetical protein